MTDLERKIVFVNTATQKAFAEYYPDRPDDENKFWTDPSTSIGEINGLLKWMGRIHDYVMDRKFLPVIRIPVDVEPAGDWLERCHTIKEKLDGP